MKKFKFLALAIALAVMLMGAGYAAWTDSFKTTTTLETGNLKIELSNAQESYEVTTMKNDEYAALVAEDNVYRTADRNVKVENGVLHDVAIDHETNTVSFGFGNLYPGTTVWTTLEATNTGTVPAVLENVEFNITDSTANDIDLAEVIEVIVEPQIIRDGAIQPMRFWCFWCWLFPGHCNPGGGDNPGNPEEPVEPVRTKLANLDNELDKFNGHLCQNDKLRYNIGFVFPEGNGNITQDESVAFDLQFNFKQYNLVD
ncbi:hypothetical protein [Desulfofalx alkaliphila]|uniref:hypothetical protein n=1 Tax=Desulfofalx alkaliphila TaxID=105483 RepID=UPI0004E1F847|nr:hypothetical protein [Desulfofalx alkaliphila]